MAGRLATSVSPYLRSHADNPVDWWRWGEEPFAEAVRRDVPVIVSIGYATCHWCHVMARESFSDPELAGYLNENFVAIKVDREEHPDVDATFLAAASAFTRHLGWPLTVFTTPDGNPVFGGTYFPPVAAGGLPSFRDVLEAVTDAWTNRRDDLEATGRILAEAIATRQNPEKADCRSSRSSRRRPSLSKFSRIPSSAASAATPSSRRLPHWLSSSSVRRPATVRRTHSCDARWRPSRVPRCATRWKVACSATRFVATGPSRTTNGC